MREREGCTAHTICERSGEKEAYCIFVLSPIFFFSQNPHFTSVSGRENQVGSSPFHSISTYTERYMSDIWFSASFLLEHAFYQWGFNCIFRKVEVFGIMSSEKYFRIPGVFVGFNPKNADIDAEKSPTSPLDFKVFCNVGNPVKPQRSSNEVHQKSWDCSKVGLSIINSLDDDTKNLGKVIQSSNSNNILFGPRMRIKNANFRSCIDSLEAPKSLPKFVGFFPSNMAKRPNKDNSDVVFEIGGAPFTEEGHEKNLYSCSLDSGRSRTLSANLISKNAISHTFSSIRKLSSTSVELSEDYTCVRKHGPNPKVTHIFGDCILECCDKSSDDLDETVEKIALPQGVECSDELASYPSGEFLKFCYSCKKKLDGEDVYMYRGEKAFCSWTCRSQEILVDEVDETNNNSSENSVKQNNRSEESFENSLFVST